MSILASINITIIFLLFSSKVFSEVPVIERFDCILEPNIEVNVSSPVPGVLDKLKVDKGDRVTEGEPIIFLKSRVEKAAVNLAKARYEFAKRKVERNEEMYQDELISAHEKDEIITEAKVAEMELEESDEIFKLRTVRSPINGVVSKRNNSRGEYVGSDPILTMVSIDPLYVEVIVPVERFGSIEKGMVAEIFPESPVGGTYKAKVIIVESVIDAASGTFGVRLELANSDHKIPAGLKCKIEFP